MRHAPPRELTVGCLLGFENTITTFQAKRRMKGSAWNRALSMFAAALTNIVAPGIRPKGTVANVVKLTNQGAKCEKCR